MTELALLPAPPKGVEWSATHISVLDPSLPFEEYEGLVEWSGILGDAGRWFLGDLQIYGEARFGERFAQALGRARVGERSLRRYRYVALQVPSGQRRPNLSFSHHEMVARLAPPEQSRLLERAASEGLSTDDLLELVRDLDALGRPAPAARQQVLGAPAVDTTRSLSQARETLRALGAGLEPATAEEVGIPRAIRELDEASQTIKKERVEQESLVDAARRVVKNATVSGSFYMVELDVFQTFAALVAAE